MHQLRFLLRLSRPKSMSVRINGETTRTTTGKPIVPIIRPVPAKEADRVAEGGERN